MRELIARVNLIRREHPALQHDRTLRFHPVDNDQMIAYSKTLPDGSDPVVVIVNLDPEQPSVRLGRPAHAGARDGLGRTLRRPRPPRRRVLRLDPGLATSWSCTPGISRDTCSRSSPSGAAAP